MKRHTGRAGGAVHIHTGEPRREEPRTYACTKCSETHTEGDALFWSHFAWRQDAPLGKFNA